MVISVTVRKLAKLENKLLSQGIIFLLAIVGYSE